MHLLLTSFSIDLTYRVDVILPVLVVNVTCALYFSFISTVQCSLWRSERLTMKIVSSMINGNQNSQNKLSPILIVSQCTKAVHHRSVKNILWRAIAGGSEGAARWTTLLYNFIRSVSATSQISGKIKLNCFVWPIVLKMHVFTTEFGKLFQIFTTRAEKEMFSSE